MPASEAQIRANQQNSLKSTGPKTPEGKERSRANALKHGLTGEGVALTAEDTAEVERMFVAFEADFRPSDEMGRALVRRAAVCMVRMERSVLQETAALNQRVAQAQAEAEANGEDPVEAAHRAMFDPSKDATLARRYEAAAERGFFRAIKEFRQRQKEAKGPDVKSEAAALRKQAEQLASFFPAVNTPPSTAKPAVAAPSAPPKPASKPAPAPVKTVIPAWNPVFGGSVDVPITIGRPR
jgi:hypothetical protein